MSTTEREIADGITITRAPEKPPTQQTATTEPARTPTAEELRKETEDLYTSMGWGKPPEPKAQTALPGDQAQSSSGDGGAAGAPQPGVAAPEAPLATPVKPAATAEPEEPQSTTEIITQAARETARELARVLKPEPQTPTPAAQPQATELTAEDQSDLRAIQYLERANPKQYKGRAQQFIDYCKARYEYEAKWARENPDKELDENDEEHQRWYQEHEPDIDLKQLEDAHLDMKVDERFEKRLKPKEDAERAQKAFAEEVPRINTQISQSIVHMIGAVNPELAKLVTDAGGKPVLTDENINKIDEADPIAKDVMDDVVANHLEPMILELEKTQIPDLKYRLNPEGNAIHARIATFIDKKERDMASAPADVRNQNGKEWVSLAEYARRANSINGSNLPPAEKQRQLAQLDADVWTISVDMIEELIADDCAKLARRTIEKRDSTAKKKYTRGAPAATATAQPATAAASATPAGPMPAGYKYRSPSGGGQADVATAAIPDGSQRKSLGEVASDVNFSR